MKSTASLLSRWPATHGESFEKISRLHARTTAIDRIQARAEAVLDRVPITRVTDITALDVCGVPVFAAITPLAHDLTTQLGKGLSPQAARVSAIMEAIERVSAEQIDVRFRRASYETLRRAGLRAADPLRFDLPPRSSYRSDGEFDWVEGWDLISAQPVWILADLVRSPAREGVLDQVDTNGLAAGATYGEAVRHALLEAIERDAVSQVQFFDLYGEEGNRGPPARRIDPNSVPESTRALFDGAASNGLEIVVDDLTGEIGVPVFSCTLADLAFPDIDGPSIRQFGGWGADPQAEVALNRAVTEAFQSRLSVIQGARDSYNQLPDATRTFTRKARRQALEASSSHSFSTTTSYESDDIADDVDFVLDRLVSIGIEQAIVVDVSRRELGIPVVRVRVPSLSVFVVDRQRLGWRCARLLL